MKETKVPYKQSNFIFGGGAGIFQIYLHDRTKNEVLGFQFMNLYMVNAKGM